MLNMAVAAMAMAMTMVQDSSTQNTTMMHSGPWKMRKSTGNETMDKLYFAMDRTLNAAEADTLMTMFRRMGGAQEMTIQRAIVKAIEANQGTMYTKSATGSWGYPNWESVDMKPMNYAEVYTALENGLNWAEVGVLSAWAAKRTVAEQDAVIKLVQRGGWAMGMWPGSAN